MEITGKVALVTGGASGIGRATALRLADEGARVVVADIDASAGADAADACKGRFSRLDVSDAQAFRDVVREIQAREGGLDIAYLNAGITTYPASAGGLAPFDVAALDLERYRRIMGVNVDGVVFGVRAVVPALEARGGGAIVATASVAGLIGFPPDPVYTATKHAVVGLVRALARPLEERRIAIHAICPGGVATNILGPGLAERARAAGTALMAPEQIADAVVHALRSEQSGGSWVCLLGRPPQRHAFAPVEGLA